LLTTGLGLWLAPVAGVQPPPAVVDEYLRYVTGEPWHTESEQLVILVSGHVELRLSRNRPSLVRVGL